MGVIKESQVKTEKKIMVVFLELLDFKQKKPEGIGPSGFLMNCPKELLLVVLRVLAVESIDTTFGIDEFLLTGEERVALGADTNGALRNRGIHFERVAACAADNALHVVRMLAFAFLRGFCRFFGLFSFFFRHCCVPFCPFWVSAGLVYLRTVHDGGTNIFSVC
jgi:hypothetical protein